ncbi:MULTISPECIES: YqzH family protein [Bacillaceae]|uniref:YqzH family protein n=1 Tax=Bacillaceae TaxID=186817 RepID=UPI0020A35460|nr:MULTISPECIES: YqzH family protein [Bacillaceae]MCM3766472.1 YqzH family protein [Neobacillus niacini]
MVMEKKLVVKMIKNCFKQYYRGDSLPVDDQEMEELVKRILQTKHEEPAADLYEVVNDMVYEYLTGS